MIEKPDRERQLVVQIVKGATLEQTDALRTWALKLLEIRKSGLPARTKAKQAIAATVQGKVVGPMLKRALGGAKSVGWDNRTTAQRLGLGGAAVGVALFGGQGAGIVALGMGVGVPLWAVLGAGSMFATYLYEELAQSTTKGGATYTVIDAEKEDRPAPSGKRPPQTPAG
ncbi:hypothetical protein EN828_25410 [Mesorhizobium sp. M2D.F.Ca.ET.185.01.1.1]|uniref:hypothetical protein n=3 Tax=Mesorhizobium TaxID=68287 RepID=UPI000FCBE48A|nr:MULTISPECIES: hypothetical protein [unclassified Mesorhizobium]TGU12788.1 hypothetical protein EN806_15505 [bacterium M00.F.Ca.ET.163.01.1.1]TGU43705.1 hypothetical protein EN789_26355 [bacterium M00.F.Ca.ET.146.01.1.1]TGV79845.1 hypothetical protein EN792_040555 [Mesorhizobium sp. M00.F.Ca.ET.149.01.1.1]TGW09336.1 hypothetical protein EN788_25845 [Mesorhizobium sp. M2D.F.Ca.ET.145.01.1.1]TGP31528.1 hypothetical protein EN875_021765 [Mesorhizobium sp. M2D.F.Ca.ET.232.01.1.1]